MKIINLTKKDIVLYNEKSPIVQVTCKNRQINVFKEGINPDDYLIKSFKANKSRPTPYVEYSTIYTDKINVNDYEITLNCNGLSVKNLPPYKEDVYYIVSSKVVEAIKQSKQIRDDLIYPDRLVSKIHNSGTFFTMGTLSFGF